MAELRGIQLVATTGGWVWTELHRIGWKVQGQSPRDAGVLCSVQGATPSPQCHSIIVSFATTGNIHFALLTLHDFYLMASETSSVN